MRTEREMMDVLLNVASNDEHIRAVFMNGLEQMLMCQRMQKRFYK